METQRSGQAVAALVLGIISIIGSIIPILGIVCGIIGIVLGARTKATDGMGKGGFICSIIGVVLSVALWIFATSMLIGIMMYAE